MSVRIVDTIDKLLAMVGKRRRVDGATLEPRSFAERALGPTHHCPGKILFMHEARKQDACNGERPQGCGRGVSATLGGRIG